MLRKTVAVFVTVTVLNARLLVAFMTKMKVLDTMKSSSYLPVLEILKSKKSVIAKITSASVYRILTSIS